MTPRLAWAIVIMGVAGAAFASSAPAPQTDEGEENSSAAVAGRFTEMPPSDHAYPTTILLQIRAKLTGENKLPEGGEKAGKGGGGNGH